MFDPACGSGSLLLEVGNCCNVRNYYGQELNSSTYNLARMNMLLHNIDYPNFKIVNCDTLTDNTHFGDEPFEVQVANPPYSLKWDSPIALLDDERYSTYGKLAPKSAADFAFVQTMIYHMKEGDSRVVVLLPHGVLFRGGAEEMIRKYMIKELNVLDAVVGLPANCFQGTSIPVCCLVFKKERNGNSNNVCFIDASKYYSAGKNMNYITDEDIDRIVDAYVERKDIDKFCHIASMDEIIENDYNLNIPRYVDTFEEEEPIDIPTVKANIAKHMEESKAIDAELEDYFKQLGI